MELVIFIVLALIAVAAGVGVIAQRSAVKSALFLLVNFCCLAGLYLLLNAEFLAVVQVIIYAGAVVVLVLFVVLQLGVERAEEGPDPRRYQWIAGGVLAVLLLAGIVLALISSVPGAVAAPKVDNVRALGAALLTDFVVPFEMTAVVLLVAIVGAVVLAKSKLEGERSGRQRGGDDQQIFRIVLLCQGNRIFGATQKGDATQTRAIPRSILIEESYDSIIEL